MNDTQSGGVSGRGCRVSRGGKVGFVFTCTLPSRRPLSLCSGDGRLFQGGVVRISWLVKNVYIASPLISNRPPFLPIHQKHTADFEAFKTPQLSSGCVGSQSVCAQAAWKVQPVEDCWQATKTIEHLQSLQRICLDRSKCCSS